MTELAFIALGSNIEPEHNLRQAVRRLEEIGPQLAVSRVYENPAIGPTPQPDFLNAAVLLETGLPATDIRGRLRQIESDMGRVRTDDRFSPRPIDLDLCLLGALVLSTPELILPDPDLLTRPHLAVTLAELAADFPHPLTGEPLAAIAERLRRQAPLLERSDVSLDLPGAAGEQHGPAR